MNDTLFMNDQEYFEELVKKREAEELRLFEDALALANRSGKEPFDLDRFEQIYDTSTDTGRLPPREDRQIRWVRKYYISYPQIKSIKDFAALMTELEVYR